MAFNKEQFKTIKGIFLTVNGKDYQSNFSYNKHIEESKSYTVELFASNIAREEHLFIWNNQKQFWQCKHPERLSIQLLQALTKKIEQIEEIQ